MFFFLGLLAFLITKGNSATFIQNCGEAISGPNSQIYCIECLKGFVVDYDFQSCILASELPMSLYSYCKRLDRNRECDEALSTIQIDQNQLFVKEDPISFDRRCAKIDTINNICISPRFPYQLDIDSNYINHYYNNYCRLSKNGQCIQNYVTFLKQATNQNYFQIQNFINPNLIDPNVIFDFFINCLSPYVFSVSAYGCIPTNFKCKQNDGIKCICQDGEAIDSTGSSCSKSFPNCLTFVQIGLLQYCSTCKNGYYLNQNQCVPFSSKNQPLCDSGFQLDSDSLNYLLVFLANINSQSSLDISDPNFLVMLRYSIEFFKDPKYSQFKGSSPNFAFNCQQIPSNYLINQCSQYISNLCIKCQNNEVYYVKKSNSSGNNVGILYQSICGQSEDQGINNCKVIYNNQCVVCKELYVMNQYNQCVQGKIEKCLTYDSYGKCKFCSIDYVVINNSCVPMCDQGMIYVNIAGFQCLPFKNQWQQCLINDNSQGCIQCAQSYFSYLFQQKYECSSYNRNFCMIYNSSSQRCQICQFNYKLVNDICYGSFQYVYGQISGYQGLSIDYYQVQNTNICPSNDRLCQYQNKKGYYLDYNFTQQECQLTNAQTCNKCYKNICLDKIYQQCPAGQGWSQTFNQCAIQCQNGKLMILKNQCMYNQQFCDNLQYCGGQCTLVTNSNYCSQAGLKCLNTNLNIIQCQNCSLTIDSQQCNNSCSNNQYYNQKSTTCYQYCGNGIIATDQSSCKSSNQCIDGFSWSFQLQKCLKGSQSQCSSVKSDSYVKQCPNCSLVTDTSKCPNVIPDSKVKLCQNCSMVSDIKFCLQNSCTDPYCNSSKYPFYNQLTKTCMFYCGKGVFADEQIKCNTSKKCIDKFMWSDYDKICLEKICEFKIQDKALNIFQCPNCSLVTNIELCQNDCKDSQFYFQSKCMTYCQNGFIASHQTRCESSNLQSANAQALVNKKQKDGNMENNQLLSQQLQQEEQEDVVDLNQSKKNISNADIIPAQNKKFQNLKKVPLNQQKDPTENIFQIQLNQELLKQQQILSKQQIEAESQNKIIKQLSERGNAKELTNKKQKAGNILNDNEVNQQLQQEERRDIIDLNQSNTNISNGDIIQTQNKKFQNLKIVPLNQQKDLIENISQVQLNQEQLKQQQILLKQQQESQAHNKLINQLPEINQQQQEKELKDIIDLDQNITNFSIADIKQVQNKKFQNFKLPPLNQQKDQVEKISQIQLDQNNNKTINLLNSNQAISQEIQINISDSDSSEEDYAIKIQNILPQKTQQVYIKSKPNNTIQQTQS
ncbi:hypothetical protein ABPG74_009049 [Tetrahymena malaccensis]